MKKIFTTLFTIGAMLTVIALVHFVSAGTFVPGTITPPTTTPAQFLDQSATGQTKQGWLRLGGSGDPTTTLDVLGTTATNTLGVIGNATVVGKLHIGGNVPPTASDPALVITGGFARSSQLTGIGDRPLCATATGLIKVCGTTTAPTGVCGSANSTTPVASAPTTGLCSTGTASSVTSGTSAYSWTCTLGTTTPTACSVPKTGTPYIPGICGSVSGSTITPPATLTATSPNLCSSGSVGSFGSTTSSYSWMCNAISGSTTSSSCGATITTPPITWNSSSCIGRATSDGTAGYYTYNSQESKFKSFYKKITQSIINSITEKVFAAVGGGGSPGNQKFFATCPNATFNSSNVTTFEVEKNGTISNVNNVVISGSTVRLGNIIDGTSNNEFPWNFTTSPYLKSIRFRPVSGTTKGNWSQYWAYFKPDIATARQAVFISGTGNINLVWTPSVNENSGTLPKVIGYQITACPLGVSGALNGSNPCILIKNTDPNVSSYSFNPSVLGFSSTQITATNPPYKCSMPNPAGGGGNVDCRYWINAMIHSDFIPQLEVRGGSQWYGVSITQPSSTALLPSEWTSGPEMFNF